MNTPGGRHPELEAGVLPATFLCEFAYMLERRNATTWGEFTDIPTGKLPVDEDWEVECTGLFAEDLRYYSDWKPYVQPGGVFEVALFGDRLHHLSLAASRLLVQCAKGNGPNTCEEFKAQFVRANWEVCSKANPWSCLRRDKGKHYFGSGLQPTVTDSSAR